MAREGIFIPTEIDLKGAVAQLREFERIGKQAGQKTADELTKAFRTEYQSQEASLREQLVRGLNPTVFRSAIRNLKKDFNDGVLTALAELRKSGKASDADLQKLQRTLKSVASASTEAGQAGAKSFGAMERAGVKLRDLLAGFAVFFSARAIGQFFRSSLEEARNATQVWSLLENAVENAGETYATVRPEIERTAAAFQKSTRFGDEDFAGALGEVVTITNSYARSLANMDVVLDVAAAKHLDLRTAAQLVGRALNRDTSTLKRYGIVVQEGSDAVQVMRERFQGAAEREGKSLAGRLAQLSNGWSDFKEEVGRAVFETDAAGDSIGSLVGVLESARQWVADNKDEVNAFATGIAGAIVKIGELIIKLHDFEPASFKFGEAIGAVLRKGAGLGDLSAASSIARAGAGRFPTPGDRPRTGVTTPPPTTSTTGGGGGSDEDDERAKAALRKQQQAVESLTRAIDELLVRRRTLERSTAEFGVAPDALPQSILDRLKRAVELEERLQQLRKQQQAAGAAAPAGTADLIAESQKQLDELNESLAETARKATAIPAAVAAAAASVARDTLKAVNPLLSEVEDRLGTVKAAQRELEQAQRTGDQARARTARDQLRTARAELQEAGAAAARALEKAGIPAALLQQLFAEIDKAITAAGLKTEDFADGAEDGLESAARGVEVLLRGLLAAADAMGVFDDRARRAFTGVLDLVAGVQQLSAAQKAAAAGGGLLATLSGVGAIAGAAVGIGSAILGGGDEDEVRRREEFASNTRAIIELTAQLEAFGADKGPLQTAIERAAGIAFDAIEKATGKRPAANEDLGQARFSLTRALSDADRAAATAGPGEQGAAHARAEALRSALQEFDKAVERLKQQTIDQLAIQELEATGTRRAIEAKQFEIELAKQLDDAIAAFGEDRDVVKEVERVQGLRRAANEQRLADEERRAIQDSQLATLEAQGKTKTAAVTRLLIEQQRELDELRKDGASADELNAKESEHRAQRIATARALGDDLLERAARRRGDSEALIALEQARLTDEYDDQREALQALFDAAVISGDELATFTALLNEDFRVAMANAGSAIRELVQSEHVNLLQRGAGLGLVDPQVAFAAQQAEDRERFLGQFGGVPPSWLLELFDRIQKAEQQRFLDEKAGPSTANGAGPEAQGQTEVTRGVTSIAEVTAQGLAGTAVQTRDLIRELLRRATESTGYLATLAGQPPNVQALARQTSALPSASTPRIVVLSPAGRSGAGVEINDPHFDVDIAGNGSRVTSDVILDAIRRDPRIARELDKQLAQGLFRAATSQGISTRNR